MAGPTLDTNLAGIYKTWYTDKSPEDAFFRNSPVVKRIPKNRIGGKTYNIPLLLGNGGSASGDLVRSTANATANGSAPNVEFAVTNGQLFATFFITQQEIMASMSYRGAYMPAAVNRMAQGLDSLRKLAATSLYGTGFGEIGQVTNVITVAIGSQTIDVGLKSTVVKLSIGSVFRFTNGATPASLLRTSVNTVTKISGTVVTFTATAADGLLVATDWICLDGCRSGTVTPLLPPGLPAWVPYLADRTGGTWTTYIGTTFFGVDRSVYVEGAAGQFVKWNGTEKKADLIVRGLEAVRTAGGEPQIIVINSLDWNVVVGELNAQTTLFQSINVGGKNINDNNVGRGISSMKYAFSTSFVDEVWDDPFCPQNVGWILQVDTLEFVSLNGVEGVLDDGIVANNPGKEDLLGRSAPNMDYYWLIQEFLTSQPAAVTQNGPALQVIAQMYGAWVAHNPSKSCVFRLT